MKSHMQYLIWASVVAQLQKAGETHSPYYNKAYGKMKLNEPSLNANERSNN